MTGAALMCFLYLSPQWTVRSPRHRGLKTSLLIRGLIVRQIGDDLPHRLIAQG